MRVARDSWHIQPQHSFAGIQHQGATFEQSSDALRAHHDTHIFRHQSGFFTLAPGPGPVRDERLVDPFVRTGCIYASRPWLRAG